MKNQRSKINGQAIFLVVLVIGGALLGATTIAGFLMVIQLQQVGDAANSAKAIFAAEAGVNCALYDFYNSTNPNPTPYQCFDWSGFDLNDPATFTGTLDLEKNTSASFTCYKDDTFLSAAIVQCTDSSSVFVLSRGVSGTAKRALLYSIIVAPPVP